MPPLPLFLLVIIGAYLLGGIPFGYMIGRLHGIDIRQHGSGNIGATNVLRTLGKKWGITCFLLDFCKGLLPVLTAQYLARAWGWYPYHPHVGPPALPPDLPAPRLLAYLPLLVVFATVAGHIWTPYLRFKGGKGIATSAGALMGVAPLPVLCALAIWGLSLALFRMVGLASVLAALALPLAGIWPGRAPRSVLILLTLLGLLALIRHRANIRRILAGTEPKIGQKKDHPTHEASSTQ